MRNVIMFSLLLACGEGTIVGGSAGSSGSVSCTYTAAGDYTVTLSWDFTYFGGTTNKVIKSLIKLNKSGITKMSNVCDSTTTGIIPPLPSTLKDATSMFSSCTGINSPYPKLPDTLEIADSMFRGSTKFTGSVALPTSLKSAKFMFYGNTGLQSVTGLENTQITDGTDMFTECTGLTSVPTLPSGLTNAKSMFYGCTKLKGTVSAFPTGLNAATCVNNGPCRDTFANTQVKNNSTKPWPEGAW